MFFHKSPEFFSPKDVTVYEGKEGMKAVMDDILNNGSVAGRAATIERWIWVMDSCLSSGDYASYQAIIPCLEGLADRWGGWDQALLLAYRLGGLEAKASTYEENRGKICITDPAYSNYFDPFLARYRQEFGRQDGI